MFSRNEPLIYQYAILGLIRYGTDNNQKCVFILNQAKITNKTDQLYTSWARHIGQCSLCRIFLLQSDARTAKILQHNYFCSKAVKSHKMIWRRRRSTCTNQLKCLGNRGRFDCCQMISVFWNCWSCFFRCYKEPCLGPELWKGRGCIGAGTGRITKYKKSIVPYTYQVS